MKILFVCRKFDHVAGGVERMSIALMNEMIARGHSVELLTWDRRGAQPHYEMAAGIDWTQLDIGNPDLKATWKERLRRQIAIRRSVGRSKPDVIIAFQSGTFIASKVAVLGKGIPVIASERNSPQRFDYLSEGKSKNIIYLSMLLAKYVTVQFSSYSDIYPAYLRHRIVAIPNPVWPADRNCHDIDFIAENKIVLNVGRLSHQKNQAFLIRAFSSITRQFPEWKLVMVGDGELETELKALANELGLSQNILFTGALKDVSAWYARAGVFALPSNFEGFPNALAEALTHGVPAIGLEQTAGVNELISHGRNGLLTDKSVQAFSDGLRTLMHSRETRRAMSKNAVTSMTRYEPKKIFDQWEHFFHSSIEQSP